MKPIPKTILIAALAVLLAACESANNYSKQLESERKQIDAWFARNGYSVQTECPADSAFVIGQWYRIEDDGIYFCIDSLGDTSRSIQNGDRLNVRYKQSTLEPNALVISYWTTLDSPRPLIITKGSSNNSCSGWDEAFALMRYSGTIAQIIVPSKLGFSAATSAVVPYYYKLKMTFEPK